jgi:galactokinase
MARVGELARFDRLNAALGGVPGRVRFARAPGRVNLIGDHTDYQGGLCLPMAIDRDVLIGFRPATDGRVRVHSFDLDADLSDGPWARPVEVTVALLAPRAPRPFAGFDAAVASTVPIGAGLSSSAAFGVALAVVTATVAGVQLDPVEVALVAQALEQAATGVPCGLMDQLASVGGRIDHALLVDCRALTISPVPMPPDVGVLVIHSGVERQLGDSAYATRRHACETAAARLGVATLRDATIAQVADDPFARHVVTENLRVEAFADAFAGGDVATAGALMLDSHRSLRDDFDVSTAELDLLVELCVDAGAYGARLTGAGFGGCVIALVPRRELDGIAAVVGDNYRATTGREPNAFAVSAVAGAGLVDGT